MTTVISTTTTSTSTFPTTTTTGTRTPTSMTSPMSTILQVQPCHAQPACRRVGRRLALSLALFQKFTFLIGLAAQTKGQPKEHISRYFHVKQPLNFDAVVLLDFVVTFGSCSGCTAPVHTDEIDTTSSSSIDQWQCTVLVCMCDAAVRCNDDKLARWRPVTCHHTSVPF